MGKWRVIARHNWVSGATITESDNDTFMDGVAVRRFTATVRGWRNWRIYEGKCYPGLTTHIIFKVKEIRDRIDAGAFK